MDGRLSTAGLRLGAVLHRGPDRPHETVGQQHAQEGADQRAANQMAEHGGRLGDRPHGVDDAEDGRDDAERRQCVGGERDRMRHRLVLRVVGLDLLVHQRLHLVVVVGAEGKEA